MNQNVSIREQHVVEVGDGFSEADMMVGHTHNQDRGLHLACRWHWPGRERWLLSGLSCRLSRTRRMGKEEPAVCVEDRSASEAKGLFWCLSGYGARQLDGVAASRWDVPRKVQNHVETHPSSPPSRWGICHHRQRRLPRPSEPRGKLLN